MKLYKHQQEALAATQTRNKVAYYLDMGLGKTFVASEKMTTWTEGPFVVVCQKSKVDDWYSHFETHYPNYELINYTKIKKVENTHNVPNTKTIIIINYDLIRLRPEFLKLKDFTLVLDESSYVKNEKSKRTKFIMKLKYKNLILLSGTPTGGKYEELYSQLKMLGYPGNKAQYWDRFIETVEFNVGGWPVKKVVGYKNVDELKRLFVEYGAIFMKTDDVFELPDQIHTVINCKSVRHYNKFKRERYVEFDGVEIIGDTSLTRLLGCRQIASMYNPNKLSQLETLIESTADRLIIFYNFNHELDIIKEVCKKNNRPVSVVNGSKRDLTAYETESDSITLIQYQAGAMGLNLQKANHIVYFSLPLSSELFEQSKKRIHRLGQERTCFYYYLLTDKTVDVEIMETLRQRRDYTDILFEKEN